MEYVKSAAGHAMCTHARTHCSQACHNESILYVIPAVIIGNIFTYSLTISTLMITYRVKHITQNTLQLHENIEIRMEANLLEDSLSSQT